ncbi:MAG: amidohydrolase [Clostridia bacterium]|nr:amidohydrolase [Clostridia bacterium]
MKTVLKNVTLLREYGFGDQSVCVTVDGHTIESITREMPDTTHAEVVDCKGNLLIPAFYNAHSHAAMTLFRGYGEDLPLQKWLNDRILPAEDRLTYRSAYVASKLAIAEMLRAGIVSFSDMYMFMDATAEAVLETGIKANLARCVVSFDPDIDMTQDYRTREALELAEKYHGAGEGRLKIDLSLHAEYTNVPRCCSYLAELARDRQMRMQIHLSETQKEQADCIRRHGKTPAQFFYDLGVFDVPTTAAHCVWVTDEDVDLLAKCKVFVAHNPVSNLKLGSGVMPLQKLLAKGVTVALGTDGAASNNRLDLFREMQTAAILHKGVQNDPALIAGEEIFRLATRNGALSQGRDDCGEVRVGMRADLLLIDRNSLHNMPCYDEIAMLLYSADSHDVLMTMVDGRILYQNGAYTSIDEERLRFECREVFSHYFD